jgi:hypothetical protein
MVRRIEVETEKRKVGGGEKGKGYQKGKEVHA